MAVAAVVVVVVVMVIIATELNLYTHRKQDKNNNGRTPSHPSCLFLVGRAVVTAAAGLGGCRLDERAWR